MFNFTMCKSCLCCVLRSLVSIWMSCLDGNTDFRAYSSERSCSVRSFTFGGSRVGWPGRGCCCQQAIPTTDQGKQEQHCAATEELAPLVVVGRSGIPYLLQLFLGMMVLKAERTSSNSCQRSKVIGAGDHSRHRGSRVIGRLFTPFWSY